MEISPGSQDHSSKIVDFASPSALGRTESETDVLAQVISPADTSEDGSDSLHLTLRTVESPAPPKDIDGRTATEVLLQTQPAKSAVINHPTHPLANESVIADTSSSVDAIVMPLAPNYPPIVYPTVGSPGPPRVHESTENNDKMEIDADKNGDEDGTTEDEDASSEVSEGQDLKADLENALQGDFDFKGNYAFATPLPQAPNPGLHIEGLGLIGLPLSERDAKLIIGCAAQAPFGHGERTVVDIEVRDTFEVEPANVSFQNPAWDFFVKNLVSRSVWPELGVGPYTTAPRCELYKLLLYQTGSHFLPHQDTEKEQGMFATAIIVLPSLYTGGQVHVSHGSTHKVFDLASSSAFTTSLLTWYTDVMHEVKPITSGYRLALSYNLIHTSPGIPRPTLPDMHSAIAQLRHILHKWSKGAYDGSDGDTDIIAYLLEHKYSHVNLKMGALKGEDAHLVANLRGVAEEEGFMVCLANLEYNISGVADDDGYGYYKRGRCAYDDSEDDEEVPSMMEETDTNLQVKNLVDLDGLSMMGGNLNLSQEDLIPQNPFEDVEPDDKEYEGYMGNGAGSVEYWYRRTVLVLFPVYKELDIMLNAGGVSYALQRLKRGGPRNPTEEDRKMAKYVLARITPHNKTSTIPMADFAIQWNDLAMWTQLVKASGADKNLDIIGRDKLIAAWKKFSFETVRSMLERIIEHSASLKTRLDLIESLLAYASEGERDIVRNWCSNQTSLVLSSLKNPTKEDVPVLMTVVRSRGLSFLSNKIMPQLTKIPSIYDFWIDFISALQQQKSVFLNAGGQSTSASASEEPKKAYDNVLQHSLGAAISQWESVVAQPRPYHSYPYYGYQQATPLPSKVSRIVQLADLCISAQHLKKCGNLLALVIKSQGDLATKFKTLYIPLIPELRQMLTRKGVHSSSYPFGDFYRLIIGAYLYHVLGAKPRHIRVPKLRKIGCGCGDCNAINNFLHSSASQQTFRFVQSRRTHMEGYLRTAPDMVTYSTIRSGSPHGLVVTKSQEIVAASQWLVRQGDAKTFLGKIGNDTTIAEIMGDRYADVAKALDGTQQFRLAVANGARPLDPGPNIPSNPSSALSIPASTSAPTHSSKPVPLAAPSVFAGHKRKKTPQVDGDVIDLTSP